MNDEIWFGTEASFYSGLQGLAKYDAYVAAHPNEEEKEQSSYLSIVDGVGLITVQGSLYDGKFGWIGAMFGITGYGDIQEAMIQAIESQDVKSIMLVVKSGGGAVSGVNETAQLIANVDKIKPVITYSPSMMASAALWLGASGREMFVSDTCISGSIGTLMVLASRSEQLKKEGIDARVIRSGKYKALGHPVEPLTDEAVEKAQAQADYLADIFLAHVAERRGVTKAAALKAFGEGREFVGAQAVTAGLVDGVKTYSATFTLTKSLAIPDNKSKVVGAHVVNPGITADNGNQSQGTVMPNPHIPTPEQLAALAAGVVLDAPDAAAQAAAKKLEEDAATKKAEEDAAALAAAEQEAQRIAAEADAPAQVVALTAQVETLTAEAATAKTTVETLTAEVAASKAKTEALVGLADIAKASIRTMSVALNRQVADLDAMAPEALAALHTEVKDLFVAKYKTGSVSATTKKVEAETKVSVNPLFIAAAQLKRA